MGLSRNKVAVPEGAAGSPPFYGEFRTRFVSGVCPKRVERFHGPCGDAGVEEIVGLDGPVPSGSGMGVLLGSRTATPQSWIVARFRCPCEVRGGRLRRVPRARVARGGLRTG